MQVNDYVKYMTETFVKHFDQPKSDRKKLRMERKGFKAPILFRLFGLMPLSIKMFFRRS
ncbi:YqzE family protein [Bacillus sp. FSL K6-3431]|uniref:YqzE family protein n=1 Tax=Bacillus sp. FSL K6-3431 TaxID=2921500 RepID=UPI0030F639E2